MKSEVKRMNIAYLNHQLQEKSLDKEIYLEYLPYSLSTMEDAKEFSNSDVEIDEEKAILFLAEDQKEAHGRFYRPFYTEKNNGIYFSIRLDAKKEVLHSSQLILVSTIALVETIKLYDPTSNPKIKWVNDVFLNQKKVAGILAEGILNNASSLQYIVIGVGINFSIPQDHFPDDLKEKVTSIFSTSSPSPEDFLIAFLKQFFFWKAKSATQIQQQYKNYLFVLNKPVTFSYLGETLKGIPVDIDIEGHLIVELENKTKLVLQSGEISLLTF